MLLHGCQVVDDISIGQFFDRQLSTLRALRASAGSEVDRAASTAVESPQAVGHTPNAPATQHDFKCAALQYMCFMFFIYIHILNAASKCEF